MLSRGCDVEGKSSGTNLFVPSSWKIFADNLKFSISKETVTEMVDCFMQVFKGIVLAQLF